MKRSKATYRLCHVHYGSRYLITMAGGLMILLFFIQPAQAQEEGDCDRAIATADSLSYEGKINDATDLLERCFREGAFSEEQQQQAYFLLGKLKMQSGLEDEAIEIIRLLLVLNPNYQPDPLAPPSYRSLVDREKQALEQENLERQAQNAEPVEAESKGGVSKWLLIGGGAVVAGAAVLLLAGGGGDENGTVTTTGIPAPPGRPPGN